jgi:hypothetical protein
VITAARRDLETRQHLVHPKVERLYAVLPAQLWPEILAAAEAVLEVIPEHPAARQARTRAWQQVGAISPSATAPQGPVNRAGVAYPADPGIRFLDESRARVATEIAPFRRTETSSRDEVALPSPAAVKQATSLANESSPRFLLWADTVGGYLVCQGERVVLGRAGPDSDADIPLLGDLARRHATLTRSGDSYILRAYHPTFVNGREVEQASLRDGDILRLGPSVEIEFRQPSPVSSTARLRLLSRHRLPMAVQGVILMAQTCILGSTPQAHVPAPHLDHPVVLFRQGPDLWCRAPGGFEVDGKPCIGRAPLAARSSVHGEGYSFSLEPLESRSVRG